MLNQIRNKRKTVSDQVAELLVRAESEQTEEESDAAPQVADFNEEEYELPDKRSTEIRKKNIKLLSEQSAKYRGKIASRKEFEMNEELSDSSEDEEKSDTSEDGDSEEEDFDGDLASFTQQLKKSDGQEEESDNEEEDQDGDIEEKEPDELDGARESFGRTIIIGGKSMQTDDESEEEADSEGEEETQSDEDVESQSEDESAAENEESSKMVTETNREAEIRKGLCVQNQLQIWERLLELRMRSQKIISKANELPAPTELQKQQEEGSDLKSALSETADNTTELLKSLLGLQHILHGQFSELKNGLKLNLKRTWPFSTKSDEPPNKKLIGDYLEQRFNDFRSYRNSVLLKWDDRTKLLTPGAGAKRKNQEDYDIIQKIENSLINRSALLNKSRVLKTNTDVATTSATNGEQQAEQSKSDNQIRYNVNVYDDNDFYHQQLRELIEYKANVMSNVSEVTRQYIELQKLRQKMKKKVDTRASKGRKLRYVVHNKLINFMAPDDTSTWTEESKTELYKSLFA